MIATNISSLNTVFITMVMIIGLTSLLYLVMGKMNKPIVLGGLLAGMILSNLHLPANVFNLGSCSIFGDFGITIFMMITGVRFKFATFTKRKYNLSIIFISTCFTFTFGFICAPFIYHLNSAAEASLTLFQFSLLLSISLATPAFTLVSLFLNQTHLLRLNISQVALLLSFCEDLIFWIFLAYILLSTQTNGIIQANESLLIGTFLFGSLIIGRPLVRVITNKIQSSQYMLFFLLIGTCLFAVLADSIDLHQIIGAFIFGLLLPKNNKIINKIINPLEKIASVFLLPIFFAQIGGITNIVVIHDVDLVLIGGVLTIVALVSKFCGAFIGAKILKYSNVEAGFLGGLLNLRGIFEVVVIKISWEVGLISEKLFIILVIMAIVSAWFSTTIALWFRNQILVDSSPINKNLQA